MAKINPKAKENVDGYKDQKGFEKTIPVAGTYDVVDLKVQWQKVGKNSTEKLRIITHVLRVVEAKDNDGATKMVGHTFGQDIWWNLYKDGNEANGLSFNGQRLVNLAIANGCSEEFDPENRDEIVKILCSGCPYRIKIDVEKQSGGEKDFYNVNVIETKYLSADGRKKYTAASDFAKIMPRPEERRLDDADYSPTGKKDGGRDRGRSSGGGKDKEQSADPFTSDAGAPADGGGFIDDDLPF